MNLQPGVRRHQEPRKIPDPITEQTTNMVGLKVLVCERSCALLQLVLDTHTL